MIGRVFRRSGLSQTPSPPRVPDGVRVYAIGDIHGCSHLLDELHRRISDELVEAPAERVLLIYLGDYIDRGPDSAGVVERLIGEPIENAERVFLKGNHEAMMLAVLRGQSTAGDWRLYGGMETLRSYQVDVHDALAVAGAGHLAKELEAKLPDRHREWLERLLLSYEVGDYFFCHAGARPDVALADQRERDLLWIREEFTRSTSSFERVVVHGHTPVPQPELLKHRINIDTAAYLSGVLTALVLEGPEQRLIQTGS